MRLIDADDFKKFMQALCKAGSPYESFIELLDKQNTAYDIDKVVEELEKLKNKDICDYLDCDVCLYYKKCGVETDQGNNLKWDKAIEIVKHGGVSDDVCKWKQTSTARYKTSCGYKLEEYFDTNACYCKQCGKKIKIVGDLYGILS